MDERTRYASERVASGAPIGRHQAVAFKAVAFKAALQEGPSRRPFKKEAAIARLPASQIFGGAGFMNESPVGRFHRDAKILEIGEGTPEVQWLLIARALRVTG